MERRAGKGAKRRAHASPAIQPRGLRCAQPTLQFVPPGLTRWSMLTCRPHGLPDQSPAMTTRVSAVANAVSTAYDGREHE
jgi:hypothetical protein